MLRRIDPNSTGENTGEDTDTDAMQDQRSRHRIAWVTDPHFDHATLDTWQAWADELDRQRPTSIVLTGDISEGLDVAYQLRCIAETFAIPIYFVLGNHDFYGKSISETRRDMIDLARDVEHLHYLTDHGVIVPCDGFAIVGEDGWGDATHGDYAGSMVRLNDFALIEDFHRSDPACWHSMLQDEGRQAGERLRHKLQSVPDATEHVLIATHVPPFREACWYEGQTTNDQWAPFFVCGGVGDVLLDLARCNPNCHYVVLCGHTHSDGDAEILPNLKIHTGHSRYGTLDIESIIRLAPQGYVIPRS